MSEAVRRGLVSRRREYVLGRFVAMTMAACLSVSACAVGSRGTEDACTKQAAKEIAELRSAISPLLSPEVAKTFQGNHGCDSGAEGGWISFEADRSVSGYKSLQLFRDNGWDVMDMPSDECGGCVAGVRQRIGGKLVEVTVADRSGTTLEVVARHP